MRERANSLSKAGRPGVEVLHRLDARPGTQPVRRALDHAGVAGDVEGGATLAKKLAYPTHQRIAAGAQRGPRLGDHLAGDYRPDRPW